MAYWDISLLAQDADFRARVTACASQEDIPQPESWASGHLWEIAGAGDLGDKYASAVAGGVPDPGRDPSVISDGDILAATTAVYDATSGA